MTGNQSTTKDPWFWIPSLYFAEGIPYVAVMALSVLMYKRLDISNTDIALYTSWLYLPWVIKPFWSPLVDSLKSKRWWIVVMQLLIGAILAGVALTIPASFFFRGTLAFFWLLAFSSATHDIAADGFYMYGLTEKQQTFFVGIRTTFYRLAMISGQGLLVILAGLLENADYFGKAGSNESIRWAWAITFLLIAVLFLGFSIYHRFALPHPTDDAAQTTENFSVLLNRVWITIRSFFLKKNIWAMLGFLLLYRLGESQLLKMASPFMLDPRAKGGLGLTTSEIGLIYGTIGVICLTIGGILGGWLASQNGLKHWIWLMVAAMNLPNLVYVYLSLALPDSFILICSSVALEQFGYGFGFTAYMLYMLYVSAGEHQTAHYAFCTGVMALGMMLPGMISGYMQEMLGYQHFFVWVMICTIPGFILAAFLKIDPSFGITEKKR